MSSRIKSYSDDAPNGCCHVEIIQDICGVIFFGRNKARFAYRLHYHSYDSE